MFVTLYNFIFLMGKSSLSWSWWPSGLRHLLSGVIHGQDMYWGGGFESAYLCKATN